jgi:RimJ/RimL family protein N-acetyltransferase
MIGEVHFTCNYDRTHEWEIGYKFLKEHWGNGYASEAVKAVIQYAFEHFNVNRIAAFLNAENKRSATLCERAGMVKEGCLREVRLIYCRRKTPTFMYGDIRRRTFPLELP